MIYFVKNVLFAKLEITASVLIEKTFKHTFVQMGSFYLVITKL